MSTKWNDILIRKALNDTGITPYTGGTWTNSPDIIPNGISVEPHPQQAFGAKTYNADVGKPTIFMQQNYFYVRGKNLSSGADSGKIYLYYCPQNLFLFPSLWSKNQLKTSSNQDYVQVVANDVNEVTVTPEPFTFLPTSEIHSCLITRISTANHPNPLPPDGEISTMAQLASYIASHPNMGWRNVTLVNKGIPTYTDHFTLDTTSLRPGTEYQFLIGLSYKGLTPGSILAFSSGTPIPSGPDKGRIIQLPPTPVDQSDGSLGTSYLTIPAGFKTSVSFTYTAKPPIQQDWSVQFFAIYVLPHIASNSDEHTVHDLAIPVHEHGIPGLDIHHPLLRLASNGIVPSIKLGDVSLIGQ
ncbi:hypothetical protein [Chromobacterium aquaticum]|uniref:Uncharacterized protein n=1 Tax=Chromobacterium aquaticum TaxID=467180 RepID=A0ABV8ZYM9_9NEIS|nr:hypothetical protein [Chromobacterium aquaticum]MCD5362742.1 hypothetical protein [Chromobacterium aquaticum]